MFADAGELPRIGGMRLLARGYLRWFSSRGLFTKNEAEAQPGDLVVWNNGEHIGIYLGDGQGDQRASSIRTASRSTRSAGSTTEGHAVPARPVGPRRWRRSR